MNKQVGCRDVPFRLLETGLPAGFEKMLAEFLGISLAGFPVEDFFLKGAGFPSLVPALYCSWRSFSNTSHSFLRRCAASPGVIRCHPVSSRCHPVSSDVKHSRCERISFNSAPERLGVPEALPAFRNVPASNLTQTSSNIP